MQQILLITRRYNVTWEKGQSGNPDGRPRGNKNKFTHLHDEFLAAFEEIGGREALVE